MELNENKLDDLLDKVVVEIGVAETPFSLNLEARH